MRKTILYPLTAATLGLSLYLYLPRTGEEQARVAGNVPTTTKAGEPAQGAEPVVAVPDAQDWPAAPEATKAPQMEPILAFRTWMDDYMAASPEARATMEKEGAALAKARRPEFKKLI